MRIAILDDYGGFALQSADWSPLGAHTIDVFREALTGDIAAKLLPYDIICTMRERMAMPAELFRKLPNLKLLCTTGASTATIDAAAAREAGVVVCNTTSTSESQHGTAELAFGLMIMAARHLESETARMRSGGWQLTAGRVLAGKTLGLLGLGKIGSRVASYGRAFDMNVIAWSQNLTAETAAARGVRRVEKAELFALSDFLSIHYVLSARSRDIVGTVELSAMKPRAWLFNTSRAPLVDEEALMSALATKTIGGAGLDVFHREPLPADDPIRKFPNVLLSPHLGYTVEERLREYYPDIVDNIVQFLAGRPVRIWEK